jgi:hypothetical protein
MSFSCCHELFAALSGFKIGYFGKNVNPYSAAEHAETAEVKEKKEWKNKIVDKTNGFLNIRINLGV